MRFLFLIISIISLNSCGSLKKTFSPADNGVIAHRGAWKQKDLPGNSIAALKQAIALGCEGSEFDVRMTQDRVLVVHHDPEYYGLSIRKSKYSDLNKLKLSNGEDLPTLEEYIKAGMLNNSSTGLVCELKPTGSEDRSRYIARAVLELVDRLNAQNYVSSYISFDYNILLEIARSGKPLKTQYLTGNKSPDQLKQDGITGLDYHFQVFKDHPEYLTRAKELGLTLNVWTVNDEELMKEFLNENFDFITSDKPERLFELHKQQ